MINILQNGVVQNVFYWIVSAAGEAEGRPKSEQVERCGRDMKEVVVIRKKLYR